MTSTSDFIAQNAALAASVSQNTGVPVADILGQWGLETGWGTHYAGTNNPGNVSPGGTVANYDTPQAGALAYQTVLQAYQINASTPADFAASLVAGHYATDPNYAQKIQGAIAAVNSEPSSSSILQPFNDYLQTFMQIATPAVAAAGQQTTASGLSGSTSTTNWISSHMANYGLVFFGGVLIVGALLISQRETVIKLAKDAAA
jgi:hypothetical protein